MAVLTMIIGQSGTGKSTSLRSFSGNEVAIINVSGKALPFRNTMKTMDSDSYQDIIAAIRATDKNIIVIDDASYLMVDEFMNTADQKGYEKFTMMAKNFFVLCRICAVLPREKRVYFLGHLDVDQAGREKFKTIGRLLDEKVTLEGLFPIVLKTVVNDDGYWFSTRNSGSDTVKSPMGMFGDALIPNDLKEVDRAICEYYGLDNKEDQKK